MSCSVTFQSVQAVANGSGSTLQFVIAAGECKSVEVVAQCAGGTVSQTYALTGAASEALTASLDVPCPCGAPVTLTATCINDVTHMPVPNCTGDTYQGPIPCQNECCVPPHIEFVVGPCDSANHRPVTFTTVFNVPAGLPSTCFPLIGQFNFGNGTFGPAHVMTAAGTYTYTDTSTYTASGGTTYQASFVYNNPSTCPPVAIPIRIDPCTPPDCCPVITDVSIEVGGCRPSDCARLVTIKTVFSPPTPGCQAEVLQWHFHDNHGNAITNVASNAFLTSGTSPNVQSFYFDPASAPITAKLPGLQYPGCKPTELTIAIPACNDPPACPTINAFSANVLGCEEVGGRCMRLVEFTLDAQIHAGCGSNAGTQMEVAFGDGDSTQIHFGDSGHQIITTSHHFDAGTYQATLAITNPAPCLGQMITVQVPACAPEDCNVEPACPPPPPAPWWCLCKSCWLYSQKPAKGWCKALLVLIGILVSSIIFAVYMGYVLGEESTFWANAGGLLVIIGISPILRWYERLCSPCCAACALMLGMVIAVIAIVVSLIWGGLSPVWWHGLIALAAAFANWLVLNAACQDYAEESLTQENWCQED
ncbi:hypothetical protein [Reyranella sp.]|uniref:hypothetical protein n=1 Tax=Reyranella sp. TaxID=1929291 RepID=UPI00273148AB|nr:hypothetical protein [Reyranella sp.]